MRADFMEFLNKKEQQAAVFADMLSSGCDDEEFHFRYLRALTETAQYGAVASHAEKLTPQSGSWFEVLVTAFSGHAKLALSFDADAVAAAAVKREQSASWRDGPGVYSEIKAAIRECRPFSLIRLGDGEARFLTYFDPRTREVISQREATGILDLHWDNWFGQRLQKSADDSVRGLFEQFRTAIESADILGVTPSDLHVRDNIHRGYFGGQERLLVKIAQLPSAPKFTSVFVHQDLHRVSPFYEGLLMGLDFLGVVSPHPGLAARLAQFQGIGHFREWLVPGEMRLPE